MANELSNCPALLAVRYSSPFAGISGSQCVSPGSQNVSLVSFQPVSSVSLTTGHWPLFSSLALPPCLGFVHDPQARPDAIPLARSVCRVRFLVGQDSNLIVRRIINDTIGIVSHDPALAHLWPRLAALAVTTPTRPHLASVIRHLPSVIRDPAYVIRHLSSAIRHVSSAIRHMACGMCHPAFVICHFSFPIPRSAFRIFSRKGPTTFWHPGNREKATSLISTV